MAEATRVEAEADTHHILAEAEALAEEDFHQEEVSAEDVHMEDHRQDTEDITVHRHHHTEEADIIDVLQEEVRDVPWEQSWSLL